MSKINEYLNNIMKAIYGRDVRQSIHDAIKEIDAVADTAQGSATEMARAAQQSAEDAEASKNASAKSESNARKSEEAAKKSQETSKLSETQAGMYADNAEKSVDTAAQQADAASNSAAAAKESEANARTSETKTKESETNAEDSRIAAAASATSASESASTATLKAEEANDHEEMAKSYAVGTHGKVRQDDDTDCAGYYYEQTKRISQGLSGVVPMGTTTFEGLDDPNNQQSGYLFNISDSFTSDDRFADGGGIFYGAGSNVLYTADGKWDVLAAAMVSGVKGEEETEYRQGFVSISKNDIGLGNVGNFKAVSTTANQGLSNVEKSNARGNISALATNGDSTDNTVSFTSGDDADPMQWTDIAVAKSNEKHSSLWNKATVFFKNARYLHKLIGNSQLSVGDGTVIGAINQINSNLLGSTIIARYISQGTGATEYEYVATRKCELYYSFKIPVGVVSASVTVNGIPIISMGYAWENNNAPFIIPFSCQLNKGDKAKFANGGGASVNIELQMLVIRS